MDHNGFQTTIEDGNIQLQTAADAVRFSFIVQNSLSCLDLKVNDNSRISYYFRNFGRRFISRRLKNYLNTEEKCRKFFSSSRGLLYNLHLDLPAGRECSLKNDAPTSFYDRRCLRSPNIAGISLTRGLHENCLSSFIEEALSVNIPKEKLLKWILNVPYRDVPLISRLQVQTASKFIDCFYPSILDFELFREFIMQFEIVDWMEENQQPEILEFLLYNARILENISLEEEVDEEFISNCINSKNYRNIGSILKYTSFRVPTYADSEDYLLKISSERPSLTEDIIDNVDESMPRERIYLMLQIIWIYIDSHLHGLEEAASKALSQIWSSIPNACITLGELKNAFGTALREEELVKIHDFYSEAVGEFHAYAEPRSLQHLCRTALRNAFEDNEEWIPDAIRRMPLPTYLQSYLNLD